MYVIQDYLKLECKEILIKELKPAKLIAMDNAAFHKSKN
ncbi:hypothetical protein OTSUT76_0340 [Orientia tsutsugamushi str. UT76]|nr:hypothetical protein OTSUT76_0340 [Orientia tsutsugamushi str. UT76]